MEGFWQKENLLYLRSKIFLWEKSSFFRIVLEKKILFGAKNRSRKSYQLIFTSADVTSACRKNGYRWHQREDFIAFRNQPSIRCSALRLQNLRFPNEIQRSSTADVAFSLKFYGGSLHQLQNPHWKRHRCRRRSSCDVDGCEDASQCAFFQHKWEVIPDSMFTWYN